VSCSSTLNLVFFGPPGVGKGTQAGKVAKHYNLVHISTGDIFRAEIKLETELGLKVKGIINKGDLVPDALLIAILENVFDSNPGTNGFVFDGFPRTLPQAEAFDKMLKRRKCKIHQVISLDVPVEELLSRLLNRAREQGRTDDTEEVIKKRLLIYHKHTKPLVSYYQKKGIFTEIYGVGSINDIFQELCRIIDKR